MTHKEEDLIGKFIENGLPGISEGNDWRYLVDMFRNHEIEFTISLSHIQTVFASFKLSIVKNN